MSRAAVGPDRYLHAMSSNPPDRASLEREIRQRQDSLASTVDELAGRVAPKALAKRTAAEATEKGKSLVLDEDGALRLGRIGAAFGGVLALIGLSLLRRGKDDQD